MKNLIILTGLFFLITLSSYAKVPVIMHFKEAKGTELPAVKELQRYLYVRTGELPVIKTITVNKEIPANSILIATVSQIENFKGIKKLNLDKKLLFNLHLVHENHYVFCNSNYKRTYLLRFCTGYCLHSSRYFG
ncbi:MAG TPA: hypothetical protein VIJ95_04710 [Hanamia sp.]